MKIGSQKAFHHGNLRQALLSSAICLLDEKGISAVTIRATAREAGVSHAAPVNHFRDRCSLLTAMAEQLFGELDEAIGRATPEKLLGASTRIKAFAEAIVNYAIAHPNRYRLMWRRDVLDATSQNLNVAMDAIYDSLLAELSDGLKGDKFEADTFAIALWSMCHGYVSLRLDGNIEQGADEINGQPRLHAMIDSYLLQHKC